MTKFWLSLSLLTMAVPGHAVVYSGNPSLGFWVDRPVGDLDSGTVTLWKIRIHACDNSHTDYTLNAAIDPVDGYSVQITGGDLCGATWYWSTDMLLYGNDGEDFTIEYEDNTTAMVFANPLVPTALTPYDVIEGSITGAGPKLYATIN